MNSIALQLNETLQSSVVYSLLSPLGKRLYFPQGIVSQSQQASNQKCSYNATAGVALRGQKYITHPLFSQFSPIIESDQMVGYAPTSGIMELRKRWDEHIMSANPSLKEINHSLPIVTNGITHALSLVASMFVDGMTDIFLPSPCWDNYPLIFEENREGLVHYYPMFDHSHHFCVDSWKELWSATVSEKIVIVFNFPHNPTGFTPTQEHMQQIASMLKTLASSGKKIVAIVDDAYFGLFHTKDCSPYSLFSYLADLHENIIAIKCDGATKESLVWGFRVAFITYGGKGLSDEQYGALIEKTKGAIRSSISSSSMLSQSLLLKVMNDENYHNMTNKVKEIMKTRYEKVIKCVKQYEDNSQCLLLPANSGYFVSFYYRKDGYALREALLQEGIGIIALNKHLIRIAYSSVDDDKIEYLIKKVFEGASNV